MVNNLYLTFIFYLYFLLGYTVIQSPIQKLTERYLSLRPKRTGS